MESKSINGTTSHTDVITRDTDRTSPSLQQRDRITCSLVWTVVGAVLGSFQFGYSIGVVNNPETSIKDFINETKADRTGSGFSEDDVTNLWSLAVSIFAIGGCFGGFFGGWIAQRFGRKRGTIYNAVYGIVCSVLLFISKPAASFELIIIGRFLIGVNCGIYTAISPLYLSEISATRIRGAIGVLHQLAVVIGILISQVLGFHVILGGSELWNVLLGLPAIPCILQLVILPFSPASPRFLLISRDDEDATRYALMSLRGVDDVQSEIEEIKAEMKTQERQVTILQLFLRPSLRQPLVIGIVMHLSQQLGGINGVFFYSTSLFKEAGLSQDTATYTTSAIGVIMVTMTLVTVPLMDRAGRRTLQLVGLGGMVVVGILVTVALNLRESVEAFKYVAVVVTLAYVVFFAIGPGSIPWLIVGELFSHDSRPAASSICVLVNWGCSFIVGYIFPFVQEGLGDFTFVPFVIIVALIFAFTYFKVPETKGKTIEQVSSLWKQSDQVVGYQSMTESPPSHGDQQPSD